MKLSTEIFADIGSQVPSSSTKEMAKRSFPASAFLFLFSRSRQSLIPRATIIRAAAPRWIAWI